MNRFKVLEDSDDSGVSGLSAASLADATDRRNEEILVMNSVLTADELDVQEEVDSTVVRVTVETAVGAGVVLVLRLSLGYPLLGIDNGGLALHIEGTGAEGGGGLDRKSRLLLRTRLVERAQKMERSGEVSSDEIHYYDNE